MKEELIFYERQRFKQWWALILLVIVNGMLIIGCISQIGMGKPWGNNPMSNTGLIIITVISALVSVSIFFIRLDTVFDEDGIFERFFPFQLKSGFIPWDQVADVRVKKINLFTSHGMGHSSYRLKKIGGSGYHYDTIFGKYVLQLTLENGKKLNLSTERPNELLEFLAKLNAERKQK